MESRESGRSSAATVLTSLKCNKGTVFLSAMFVLVCISLMLVLHKLARENHKNQLNHVCILTNKTSSLSWMGAKEVRRYLYLLSGHYNDLIDVSQEEVTTKLLAGYSNIVLVIDKANFQIWFQDHLSIDDDDSRSIRGLGPEEHALKQTTHSTLTKDGVQWTLCIGGDDVGSLYAAYSFAEALGVRFYIHKDVIPKDVKDFAIPSTIDQIKAPNFKVRGILPFHAYPEGPDWWGPNEYKLYLSQLTKMKMNFIGLHTYPLVEPTVWVGVEADFDEQTGSVSSSYTTSWASTLRGTWGYPAKPTSSYSYGSSMLFPDDCYSGESNVNSASLQSCPYPTSPKQSNQVFDRATALLKEAFAYANGLNMKTCVGTEVPLTKPIANVSKEDYYRGIFKRIIAAYPLDYYWLWTPEDWEWGNLLSTNPLFTEALQDFEIAHSVRGSLNASFELVSSGWELGPVDNRAILDQLLPDDYIISSIDLNVGLDPVDPAYADVTHHRKWVLPWMEDDPGFTVVQLWVNRTLEHTLAALQYNVEGLIALHWRTVSTAPQLSAMASMAWNSSLQSTDFWTQWAVSEFGANVGTDMARVFASIDSFNLPKPVTCYEGPGGIIPNGTDWNQTLKSYTFIDALEKFRSSIEDEYQANYDYWMNSFYMMREVANISNILYQFNDELNHIIPMSDAVQRKHLASSRVEPVYSSLVSAWGKMIGFLQQTIYSFGEMGTLMNMEQHNMPFVITMPGLKLSLVNSDCTEYYSYIGCYADEPQRDLSGKWKSDMTITPFECSAFCAGYPYFGLQYGYVDFYGNRSYCFCGNSYGRYGSVNNHKCNMPCSGDSSIICGGNFTNSVYNNTCGKTVAQRTITHDYQSSEPRLIVPTVRTSISKNELFSIKALVLASTTTTRATRVSLYYRSLGSNDQFVRLQMSLVTEGRQVYNVELPVMEEDFEYYIEASLSSAGHQITKLRFPEAIQRIQYQTVIVT